MRFLKIAFLSLLVTLLFQLPAFANFKIVTVQPNVETETVLAFSLTGCTPITPTNATITIQPKHGAISIVGGSFTIPGCPGVSFPGSQVNYTWTDTTGKPGSGSDAFHVKFTSAEGTVEWDILISVGINNEENDGGGPPVPTFPSCDTCSLSANSDPQDGDNPANPSDASQTIGTNGQVMAGPISDVGRHLILPTANDFGTPVNIAAVHNVATGNMHYAVTDYQTAGQNPLAFTRSYNTGATTTGFAGALGPNWRHNYERSIDILNASVVAAERPTGQILGFAAAGAAWVTNTDINYKLIHSGNTWTITGPDDTVETYTQMILGTLVTTQAQLTSIRARNGYTQTLTYNSAGKLESVADSYGRTLTFAYTNGLLSAMITPEDNTFEYLYNTNSTLEFAISPLDQSGGFTYNYLYENTSLPNALTGVLNRFGERLNTWSYDSQGHTVSSSQGGTALNANLTAVAYNSDGTMTVTNPLGVADTYTFATLQSVPKVTGISRAATSTTAAATRTFTYDANGFLATSTDWNGNKTTYVNSGRGMPTSITEATGTAQARTATLAYNATFTDLPASVVKPGATTTFTYDAGGNILTRTITDTTTTTVPYSTKGQARTWTYTYDATGHLLTSKTPNGNTTTLTYDSSSALVKIVDALSHATTITAHTAGGYPQTITDSNGVSAALTYDSQMRLTQSAITTGAGVLTTTYNHWFADLLSSIVLPGGSVINTIPDTAQRLANIIDGANNKVTYTLDALGSRIKAVTADSSGNVTRTQSATFDALGHMLSSTGGVGQTTTFTYDKNGNALTIVDPLNHTTSRAFDPLNHLIKSTDANGGVTQVTFDANDRPLSITDTNGNVTSYVYDGFGDAIQETSPDAGVTVYRYDADGNLTSKTDATGNVANLAYDQLDRVLTTSYPADATLNVSYTYDQSGHGFGIGRLTGVTDAAGSLSRSYDERGNLLAEQRISASGQATTSYAYDSVGRIASITYPSGAVSSFTRDGLGNVTQMPFSAANSDQTFSLFTIKHLPFGPVNFIHYNNGDNANYTFDQDYRLTKLEYDTFQNVPYFQWTYAYDNGDNVTSITDGMTAANSQTFAYDPINRLTGATSAGTYGSLAWAYDKNGNLTSRTAAGITTTYTYAKGANRLAGAAWPSNSQTFTYTATGNISAIAQNGAAVFNGSYNKANRLAAITGTPLAVSSIVYDAFGRRFSKANPGSTPTTFTYDQEGNLIEENNNGTITDYLYLEGVNVANWSPSEKHLYAIDFDRLGTALIGRDEFGLTNWAAFSQPYGAMTETMATGQFTGPVTQNLRLPGQYFDSEAGFHYNGFRDYIPGLGRYLESDPIGVSGGLNPYAYAGGRPLGLTDASGLAPFRVTKAPWYKWFGAFFDPGEPVILHYPDGQEFDAIRPYNQNYFNCYGYSLSGGNNLIIKDPESILRAEYDDVTGLPLQPGDVIEYWQPNGIHTHIQTVVSNPDQTEVPDDSVIVIAKLGEYGRVRKGGAASDRLATQSWRIFRPSHSCGCAPANQ